MTALLTATGDCPKCEASGFANPGELAAHLIDAHDMAGLAALAMARQAAGAAPSSSTNGKETGMASNSTENVKKTCGACGAHGHTARSSTCPKRGPSPRKKTTARCGYCKRERPDHKENCRLAHLELRATKRKPIPRGHPMPPKTPPKKAASNGLVSEIAALGAVAEALVPLDVASQGNVLGCICKLLQINPSALMA